MNATRLSRRLSGWLAILTLALFGQLAPLATGAHAEDAPPASDAPASSGEALALVPDSTAVSSSGTSVSTPSTVVAANPVDDPTQTANAPAVPSLAAETKSAPPAAHVPSKPATAKPAPAKPAPAKSAPPKSVPPDVLARAGVPRNAPSIALVESNGKGTTFPGNEHFDERGRVERSVARTASVLKTVEAKVRRSFNKKAREDFDRALGLQRESREALGQSLYARADRLTQEARSLARQIAVHLGPPQDDPDYVAIALDRTDDAIGRAKEVLRDAGGAPERGRLDNLQDKQAAARRLQKGGSTRDAYALTRDVRDGVLTLLRDCDNLPVRADTAERALKRADRALAQVKNELGERPTTAADRLARNARDQMMKAHTAFARRNYRDTLIYSKLAERDLELAVNAQRGTTNRSG